MDADKERVNGDCDSDEDESNVVSHVGHYLKLGKDAKDAIDLSIALQQRESGGSSGESDDDDGKLSVRLGLFVLSDSMCRAVLNAISEHPEITFSRLWFLEYYKKGPEDKFAWTVTPSWHSSWFWTKTTCAQIGLSGIYEGLQWHVASNLASNLLDYGLALCPGLSDETRRRVAACCAIAPQMYCQVNV